MTIASILCLMIVGLFQGPIFVHAQQQPGQFTGSQTQAQLDAFASKDGAGLGTARDPRIIIARIVKTVLTFVGILTVMLMLYAGTLIFFSGGEEDKISKGKSVLMQSVMGLIIILMAYSIVFGVYTAIYQSLNNPMAPRGANTPPPPPTGLYVPGAW